MKKDSNYLITQLLNTRYFHYYSKPVLFAAYFLPFTEYGRSTPYERIDTKIQNLKDGKHGRYNNYASQGFGNIPFYEPYIKYRYFYQRLCEYDNNKFELFKKAEIDDIESQQMKEDLKNILKMENLLLKKDIYVPQHIKKELLNDLERYENKHVLAKLIYYIVSPQHILPDIEKEYNEEFINLFDNKIDLTPNIHIGFRSTMDDSALYWSKKLENAVEMQIMCISGYSLFEDQNVVNRENELFEMFKLLLKTDKKLIMEVILAEPESLSAEDAYNYKLNMRHRHVPKNELILNSIDNLGRLVKEKNENVSIAVKTTRVYMPYSLNIAKFEDKEKDYIKIDLYSPYIDDSKQRPSMYIFRITNQNLFEHFQKVFERMWNDDNSSRFIKF